MEVSTGLRARPGPEGPRPRGTATAAEGQGPIAHEGQEPGSGIRSLSEQEAESGTHSPGGVRTKVRDPEPRRSGVCWKTEA